MVGRELCWGFVTKRTVRTPLVVMLLPLFDRAAGAMSRNDSRKNGGDVDSGAGGLSVNSQALTPTVVKR